MTKTKQQIGKLSRRKGCNNENRIAKKFDNWFYQYELENWSTLFPQLTEKKHRIVRRTPMSGGWSKCGDLKVDPEFKGIPIFPFFIEAKNEKKLDAVQILDGIGSLYNYLKKAIEENLDKNPITMVVFTCNYKPDYGVTTLSCFEKYFEENSNISHYTIDAKEGVILFPLDEFFLSADLEYFRNLGDLHDAK